MGKIYLNNFPREGAVKGQAFKGEKALEDELTKRGIIGEGEASISSEQDSSELEAKVTELQGQVDTLDSEKTELEAKVTELQGFVEEAVGLSKGTYPDGYKKD